MKRRWKAHPASDDTSIVKTGDRYVLACVLDSDPDRYVDIDLGDLSALAELAESADRWIVREQTATLPDLSGSSCAGDFEATIDLGRWT